MWSIVWSDPFVIGGKGADQLPPGVAAFAPGSVSGARKRGRSVGVVAVAGVVWGVALSLAW